MQADSQDRYSRQERFAPIGAAGQARLRAARVTIVGCGALGAATAEQLVRAGVGHCRLIDRDLVEFSNLQRQCLYTEADAAAARPKAVAAAERLQAINHEVELRPIVVHVDAGRVEQLLADSDLVLDGCDNFATRHLLNDACCKAGRPWIYAACVGAYACSMPILPGVGACLRCLQEELPAAGEGPTCESSGIIAPAVQLAAAWQVAEAFKILTGDLAALRHELWTMDLWQNRFSRLQSRPWRNPACASCGPQANYPALAAGSDLDTVLCGREAVQFGRRQVPNLPQVAAGLGERLLLCNEYLLRWQADGLTGTLFCDGRVLVQGTPDAGRARAFADRYLG